MFVEGGVEGWLGGERQQGHSELARVHQRFVNQPRSEFLKFLEVIFADVRAGIQCQHEIDFWSSFVLLQFIVIVEVIVVFKTGVPRQRICKNQCF